MAILAPLGVGMPLMALRTWTNFMSLNTSQIWKSGASSSDPISSINSLGVSKQLRDSSSREQEGPDGLCRPFDSEMLDFCACPAPGLKWSVCGI